VQVLGELKRLKKWENSLDEDFQAKDTEILSELELFRTKLIKDIKERLVGTVVKLRVDFEDEYLKAGTMELPSGKLSDMQIADMLGEADKKWKTRESNWCNTYYALMEKWRSDLDIRILKNNTQAVFYEFQQAQIRKLLDHIDPEINAIKKFIEEATSIIDQKDIAVERELKKIVYQANKKLDQQLVPTLYEKLGSKHITGLVNKLEIDVKKFVEVIAHDHVLVEDDKFDKPLAASELKRFSFNELIKFEILASFQTDLSKVKTDLFKTLEGTANKVSDLDHIITFSLNSAISASEEEERPAAEVIGIAQDGLNRAASRLDEASKSLQDSLLENTQKLEQAVNKFCSSIVMLTEHENVSQLKLRNTRAKTALQAEEVKNEIRNSFRDRKKDFLTFFDTSYQKFRNSLGVISNKFILTAAKPVLTRDVSAFLLESQSAIEKLPLIYRRLYKIEPLDDMELFEGREIEVAAFRTAFDSWQSGRYTTTIILGEKWGGFTTFLNYVIKKESLPYTIKRWSIDESVCDPEVFLKILCDKINIEGVNSQETLITHLKSGARQIMVIENLQNLYLRKTDGFRAFDALFTIISATSQQVFWVATSTIYSWNYLKKTIGIDDFFSDVIEMRDFTKEQITNVIWKRNRISGFNIRFLMDDEDAQDKKFLKLDDEKQQALLKAEFFNELNAYSRSNVSLALIFWLMSTRDIDEHTITIGEFKQPNLNFLQVLSMEKIYILLALVLHDGLNATELSEVLSMETDTCNHVLFSLLKDGIIIFKNEEYTINTIVYRSTISLLKAKNLIH
ncbi:MAG: hypothetical protein WBA74_03225, partial [Cyclobacteriaceae bacterium]